MFAFDLSDELTKDLQKLSTKNKTLTIIFRKKLREIIGNDNTSIDRYKHLRTPLHELQRIHLTDNQILLFKVFKKENKILFVAIKHWDYAYTS